MKTFENVSSLKDATLRAGQIVETKGYYSPGDGGQACYLIKTAAEYSGTPDEYGDHTLANGNVAVLQYEGVGNVKWFGAVGDGATDDSPTFVAAAAATDESVYVPVASYDLNSNTITGKFHSFGTPTFVTGTITVLNLNP